LQIRYQALSAAPLRIRDLTSVDDPNFSDRVGRWLGQSGHTLIYPSTWPLSMGTCRRHSIGAPGELQFPMPRDVMLKLCRHQSGTRACGDIGDCWPGGPSCTVQAAGRTILTGSSSVGNAARRSGGAVRSADSRRIRPRRDIALSAERRSTVWMLRPLRILLHLSITKLPTVNAAN
jgi:hypothetical protein